MLQKATVAVFLLASVISLVSCGSTANHYVYATIPAANQLIAYREDPNSGVLTLIAGSPYSVGDGASSVVIHPSGKFLYVSNPGQEENDISLFNIGIDGSLTEVPPRATVSPATLPQQLVMDPAGAYLYVANVGTNSISTFAIDSSSGALTEVTGSPFGVGLPILNMAITPSGNLLYVTLANTPLGSIAGFSVNAGVLTSLGALSSTEGVNPDGLAIDPSGTYLYAANTSSNSIAIFSIATSGALTEVAGSPLNDGYTAPIALLLDPTGKYLYVANQGSSNVTAYSISNGLPTALTTSTTSNAYTTEATPTVMTVDPSGKYMFVGNQGTGAQVQAFSVNPSSSITLTPLFKYSVGNTVSSIAVLQ